MLRVHRVDHYLDLVNYLPQGFFNLFFSVCISCKPEVKTPAQVLVESLSATEHVGIQLSAGTMCLVSRCE